MELSNANFHLVATFIDVFWRINVSASSRVSVEVRLRSFYEVKTNKDICVVLRKRNWLSCLASIVLNNDHSSLHQNSTLSLGCKDFVRDDYVRLTLILNWFFNNFANIQTKINFVVKPHQNPESFGFIIFETISRRHFYNVPFRGGNFGRHLKISFLL